MDNGERPGGETYMEAEVPMAVSFRSCLSLPISSGSGWGQDAGLGDRPHLPDPVLHLHFL